MKVSKLAGAKLDYWVGRANGWALGPWHARKVWRDANGKIQEGERAYTPSTDWAQGGPIIERERIELRYMGCYRRPWVAWACPDETDRPEGQATTPLIAAMRAFIASKYGEEVPDDRGVTSDAGSIPTGKPD